MQSKSEPGTDGSGSMDMAFKQLLDDSPVANYLCDSEGKLTYFNQAAVKLWGRTPNLQNEYWCGSWKVYHPDGTPMSLEDNPVTKVLKSGKEEGKSEIRIECPDGTSKFLLVFPRPLFGGDGKFQGAHNTLVDITEQKKDYVKKETLSAIVQSSDDAIISKSLEGIITSWNILK